MEGSEIVTSKELRDLCNTLNIKYESAIRHLVPRGHLVRIFKGIYYVTSSDEDLNRLQKYNHLELASKGLKVKGVSKWYFGLYTALKYNNMTHEFFATDYVVNDKIQRAKPMKIAGNKFRFVKVKSQLFNFGIVGEDMRYSDPEKTVLDFIYLWRYNGIPDQRIMLSVKEWAIHVNIEKLDDYRSYYPKTVSEQLDKVIS